MDCPVPLRSEQLGLSAADIDLLRQRDAGVNLAQTAARVGAAYRASAEGSGERAIAEDIVRLWIEKGSAPVREALAHQICHCPFLPRTVGIRMAHDVEPVATPILRFSDVLLDRDLCEVIVAKGEAHHAAIAQRAFIGYDPVDALLAAAKQSVIVMLVENGGAKISEPSYHRIIDNHAAHPILQEALVDRAALPLSVTERLLTIAPVELRQRLEQRAKVGMPDDDSGGSDVIATDGDPETIKRLLEQMNKSRRLTPIFLLRALCDGKTALFEAGLSKLAYLTADETRDLLGDCNGARCDELYARAGIPRPLHRIFRAGFEYMTTGLVPADIGNAHSEEVAGIVDAVLRLDDTYDHIALASVIQRLFDIFSDGTQSHDGLENAAAA